MRRISAVLLVLIAFSAHAAEVTLVDTVFQRTGPQPGSDAKLLTIHFIDVGGGDAILIDTPTDKKILIDGGYSWGERGKAKKEYLAYLDKFLEDDVIDLIVITHPDYDHFGGLEGLLDDRVVRQVWASGYDSDELSNAWNRLHKKLEDDKDTLFVSPLGRFFGLGSVVRFDNAGTHHKADDTTLTLINTKQWLPPIAYLSDPPRTGLPQNQ